MIRSHRVVGERSCSFYRTLQNRTTIFNILKLGWPMGIRNAICTGSQCGTDHISGWICDFIGLHSGRYRTYDSTFHSRKLGSSFIVFLVMFLDPMYFDSLKLEVNQFFFVFYCEAALFSLRNLF